MTKLTGGEAIVKSLIAQNVDTIFALPGVQNDYLFNAFYDHKESIQIIHPRHEQTAAYMALGYALSSNKVGVYNVVPGPGLLNTTAALATAYSLNAKVLCLTGQILSDLIGRGHGHLHEIPDQLGILKTLTKWAERINSPAEAPALVAQAFQQLGTGRPQPVGLECPLDVLGRRTEVDLTPAQIELPSYHPPVDIDAVDKAAKLLGQAKNPLIFVGGGAVDCGEEVKELAEMLQAPVISRSTGRGILSSRHYLSHATTGGHILWEKADVVIGIGTRLRLPRTDWGMDDNIKIIHLNIDAEEVGRVAKPNVAITARCEDVLPALVSYVEKYVGPRASREEEMNELQAELDRRFSFLEPQLSFVKAIRQALPDNGLITEEMTQISYVGRETLPIYHPRTYLASGYQGTLGWGFPASLGAKIANPDKPVLSVNGDGGFMFCAQELATAVQHNINVVSLVFNDSAFGNVQRMQREFYDERVIATDLQNPDFVKFAESFGAQGLRVHTPDELSKAIEKGFEESGPTLIEIPVEAMPNPHLALWRLGPVR